MKQTYEEGSGIPAAAGKQVKEECPIDDIGDDKYFRPKSHQIER